MLKNTYGLKFGKHDVQFVGIFAHVRQGDWQEMHVLLRGTLVEGQVDKQSYPSKLRVLHDVHLVA